MTNKAQVSLTPKGDREAAAVSSVFLRQSGFKAVAATNVNIISVLFFLHNGKKFHIIVKNNYGQHQGNAL